MAEQGLVASIFGKTVYELQQERIAERKKQMAAFANAAQSRGESSGIASGGFLLGSALADKVFPNTEAMEKARQAEEKQAVLNEAIAEADTTEEKLRLLAGGLSDAGETTQAINVFNQFEKAKNTRIEREKAEQKEREGQAKQNAASELSTNPFDLDLVKRARSLGVTGAEILDIQRDFSVTTTLQNDLADKELIRNLKNEVGAQFDIGSSEYSEGIADRLIGAGRPDLAESYRNDQIQQEQAKRKAQQEELSNRKSFFDNKNLNVYSYSPTDKKWFDQSGNAIEKPKGSILPYSVTAYDSATEKRQDMDLEYSTLSSGATQLKNILNDPSFEDMTGPFFSPASVKRITTELFGGKGSSTLQTIRSFTIDHTLNSMERLGGSDTIQEVEKIEAAFPSEGDDPRVWKSFFANEYADGLYKSLRKAFGEERAIAELNGFLNSTLTTSEFSDLSSNKNGLLKKNSIAYKLRDKLNVVTLNPDSIAAKEASKVDAIVNKYPE